MWWRLRVVKVVGRHGRKGDGLFLDAMFEGDGGGTVAWRLGVAGSCDDIRRRRSAARSWTGWL